jgi:transcriptional regulator with XRE-family HTH domain
VDALSTDEPEATRRRWEGVVRVQKPGPAGAASSAADLEQPAVETAQEPPPAPRRSPAWAVEPGEWAVALPQSRTHSIHAVQAEPASAEDLAGEPADGPVAAQPPAASVPDPRAVEPAAVDHETGELAAGEGPAASPAVQSEDVARTAPAHQVAKIEAAGFGSDGTEVAESSAPGPTAGGDVEESGAELATVTEAVVAEEFVAAPVLDADAVATLGDTATVEVGASAGKPVADPAAPAPEVSSGVGGPSREAAAAEPVEIVVMRRPARPQAVAAAASAYQARVPASRREPDPLPPGASIGARLAAARQSAGLTHEQLARITRIGVGRLVEFENDDYSGCGDGVFARGRLDSIARAVGVDPTPLLQEFDSGHRGGRARADGWPASRQPIRRPRNWLAVLLIALGLALVYPVALLVVAVLG